MKTFIGTKIINAMPMNRADYNAYRGWDLPENEGGADEGYLVEYTDGGKPNDDRHTGHISWSPKEQFEKAYLMIGDVSGLPPHQQRVVAEKAELDDKLAKLTAFYLTAMFRGLPEAEQSRLWLQGKAMRSYSDILGERIKAFSPEPAATVAEKIANQNQAYRESAEQETAAMGAAPRVLYSDIEAKIVSEHYFTADAGFDALRFQWLTADHADANERQAAREILGRMSVMSTSAVRADVDIAMGRDGNGGSESLGLLTFCVLVLQNGFTVTGDQACASPSNFNAATGRKIARENAIEKIWMLEGYMLKERLYQAQQPAQSPE